MNFLINSFFIVIFSFTNIKIIGATEAKATDIVITTNENETTKNITATANNETNDIMNDSKTEILPENDIITISPISDEYYKDFNSFMLGNSTIKIIQKALSLNSNKSLINNETAIDENGNIIQKEESFSQDVGNIYLKSIMYVSKNFWSVWINDKKITNHTNLNKDNEFFIKNISDKKVDIVRRVSKTKWSYINSSNKITPDEYKIVDNNVEFEVALSPNQTFVASKNKIIEGKYINEEELLINSINNENGELNLDAIFNAEEFDFSQLN